MKQNNRFYQSVIFWLLLFYYICGFVLSPNDLQFMPFKVAYWFDDSGTYANFSAFRPLLYPVILSIIKYLFGAYEKIFIIQHLVHVLACAYLWQVGRCYFKIKWAFLLVWLVIFLNPVNFAYHYAILTDSLFYSLLIIFSAQLIKAYHQKKYNYDFIVVIALAILLRPIGIVLLPMLIILYLLHGRTPELSIKKLITACVMIVTVMIAERGAHDWYHGKPSQENLSILATHMIGKAGVMASHIDADNLLADTHPNYDLASDFATEAQVFSAVTKTFSGSCFTKAGPFLEVYFQHGHFRQSKLDKASIAKISQDILRTHPLEWGKITLCHYLQGWLILPEYSVFFQPIYEQTIHSLFSNIAGNDFEKLAKIYFYQIEKSYVLITPILLLFLLMGVISFGLLLYQFYRWQFYLWRHRTTPLSNALGCAIFLSFLPHGYLLAVAIFNIASQRYTVAIFPTILLAMLFLFEQYYPTLRVAFFNHWRRLSSSK